MLVLLPSLRDALFELRHACLDLLRIHLFNLESPDLGSVLSTGAGVVGGQFKAFTVAEFSMHFKAQKIRCERLVDHFITKTEMIAKRACEQFLYEFLVRIGFQSGEAKSPDKTAKRGSRVVNVAQALQAIDPESEAVSMTMTYTERATMRTQCKKLVRFLRVFEFLVSDALLNVAILSAARLRDDMAKIMSAYDPSSLEMSDTGRRVSVAMAMAALNRTNSPLFRVEVVMGGNTTQRGFDRGGIGGFAKREGNGSPPRLQRRNSGFLIAAVASGSVRQQGSPSPKLRDSPSPGARFGVEMLLFTPNAEALRSQLETLIFNGLMAVTNRERLLCNPKFKAYVQASLDDGCDSDDSDERVEGEGSRANMDLDIMIMEESTFVEALQGVNAVILDAYDCADTTCQRLATFLERYQANLRFCTQLSDPSTFMQLEVEEFRGYLDKYTNEVQAVDALPDTTPCGLLLLDYTKLNAQLKPSPRRCLENLHVLLPLVLRNASDSLMENLTAKNDVISTIPTSVDEFAEALAFLRKLQTEQETLDDKYTYVRNLYHLIEEYNVKITDNDQMSAFLLSQKKTQLRTSMELFETSCDQYVAKFGIELEARLPGLVSQLEDISKALAHPLLFQLDANPQDTIPYLSNLEQQLQRLQTSMEQHFHYERTLSLPLTTAFDEMEELAVDLSVKKAIWKTSREWADDVCKWKGLHFPHDVDIVGIANRVQQYYQAILSWETHLPTGMNLICASLKAKVDDYRFTMPILADLRCESFEDRHIHELQTLLGFNARQFDGGSGRNEPITLGQLVKMKLTPFGEKISSIAIQAAQELLLKQSLEKTTGVWERMEFDVQQYKEIKECYVLVGYESICASLEESLMAMTSLLSSKFIAPIKDVALVWQRRLLVFQETLDAWIECQRRWMHLETIFSAPDIQKQLPNEALIFNGVHLFWKDLMKRTKDQRGCLRVSGVALIGVPNGPKVLGELGASAVSTSGAGGVGQALLEALSKHNASLERIEKSLEDYLETKRGFFPRFYFISNDELLDILAHAREPHAVQRHLGKCFDAVSRLEIRSNDTVYGGSSGSGGITAGQFQTLSAPTSYDIVAMISPEGERVPFVRMLKARGNVEDWLNSLLTNMKNTLHRHLKTALLDYQHASREAWLFRHPAQAVTVVSYIIWTRECESCLRSNAQDPALELALWNQTICAQLHNLTRVVRTSLTPTQRSVVVSLVTTDVHFRDIVEGLIKDGVRDSDEFAWQQQLRYYWHPEQDQCDVLQANCRIAYGYEYMGVCHRLVITPLTDRCWLTITGALELCYGAAPQGPAGTGKTETSRDLAKGLGILCVVSNCSDQVDYKLMGSVFNGVVQAGVWVCLDEFNRIDIEVLSVIAQFMAAIRNARLAKDDDVVLGSTRVGLKEHHIIVTMNPGYVGRTELPDNLKISFRPVAMMIPDYALIAEIILFAEGYQLAKPLSRKITKLYKLCSEQLSQQSHYDFGMRAVRSVLLMAGNLKRAATVVSSNNTVSTIKDPQEENLLLIRAVNMCNYPRLHDQDVHLFNAIVRDLFPGTLGTPAVPGNSLGSNSAMSFSLMGLTPLEDEIRRQLHHNGYQDVPSWINKILEVFVTLEIRTGVVQTGPSASGKTIAAKILKDAVTTLREHHRHPDSRYQRVSSYFLNPKSVSVTELYGFFHPVTREWTDGLVSSILRSCILEKNEQMLLQQQQKEAVASNAPNGASALTIIHPNFYWITFDGPIDVLWIESMNTVLDDNKTLCLSNGERIKLLPNIQLVFEVLDTSSASPATISRLGVVFFDAHDLGWRPFVASWLNKLGESTPGVMTSEQIRLSAKLKARVAKYFDLFIEKGIAFSRTPVVGVQIVPVACSDIVFVSTICHLFEALLFQRAPAELFQMKNPPVREKTVDRTSTISAAAMSAAAAAAAQIEENQQRCLDLVFLYSFAWSFGGNISVDSALLSFEDFFYKLIVSNEQFLTRDILSISGRIPMPGGTNPLTGNIHDFFIDFRYLSFSPWRYNSEIPAVLTNPRATSWSRGTLALHELFVPTPDVLKYAFLVELIALDEKKPVFLTGATGSGKSSLVHRVLDIESPTNNSSTGLNSELMVPGLSACMPPGAQASCCALMSRKIYPIRLQFSAQTTSALAQLSIESKLVKKRKTLLGPPIDDHFVVVTVDDINLPKPENFGGQPPIELMRQYMEFRGFYDRDKFFWKDITSSVLIGIGGIPGGGRHQLCPRIIRHFAAILCLPSCRDQGMRTIFQSILGFHITNRGANGFTKAVKDALFNSVQATCDLYLDVVQTLLPTPQKCHYLFNVRDAMRLTQGVVLGSNVRYNTSADSASNSCPTGVDLISRLWAHESIRIFRDRLTTKQDRRWLSEQIVSVGNRSFGTSWGLDLVMESAPIMAKRRSSISGIDASNNTSNAFSVASKCVLFSPSPTNGYEEISSMAIYEERLGSLMMEYNALRTSSDCSDHHTFELVMFQDAMVHTAAIARVLIQPRGHALLLGLGGRGKRSLTRLAAFMNGFDFDQVELKQNYSLGDFRDDLKRSMAKVVLGNSTAMNPGRPFALLINASHLATDDILVDVNTLLNGGEIPKLFTPEEHEKLINDIRIMLGNNPREVLSPKAFETGASGRTQSCTEDRNLPSSTPSLIAAKTGSERVGHADLTRKDCEDYLYQQISCGLHIVLCMDPSSEAFRSRVLQFPAIINCTTAAYFEDWPPSALQNIADRFIASTTIEAPAIKSSLDVSGSTPTIIARPTLSSLFVDIHQSVLLAAQTHKRSIGWQVYITCQHYLDFLALFRRAHYEKRIHWEQKIQRLTAGVVKLDETNALVHSLRTELVGLQPILIEKAQEAEVLLGQLDVDQIEASLVKERVALDESEVKDQQQAVAAVQADAQKDLDQAMPALNAAIVALDSLDKKDITEVKGFVKPPQAVQVVMEAVCIMLGEKPDWETSKRVLSRSTFMLELKDYDKDNIAPAVLKKIRKYIESPEFAVDEVKKVSRAAMSLCMWVHAIDTYARVVKEVAPKKQRLAALNAVLAEANAQLAAKEEELDSVVERVRRLQEKCDATLAEKQRLLDEAELTKARLQRAEKLTIGLNDERVRWRSSIDALQMQANVIVGDSILTAASLGYLGVFDSKLRGQLMRKWIMHASVCTGVTQPFSLLESYGDVGKLREWQLLGLPSDRFSGDSALIAIKHTERWPLMIDPQQQASQWIRRMEKQSRLEVVQSGDKNLAAILDNCLVTGRPMLVEDIGQYVDPALESIFSLRAGNIAIQQDQHGVEENASIQSLSAKKTVQLVGSGGRPSSSKRISVDMTNFCLYLTTKHAHPTFFPDVYVGVCVINFAVTNDGLEDQLLGDVVQRECAQLEDRKNRLFSDISRDQRLLVELELKILSLLSEATENLLDDVELIRALESSKATSTIVTRRLQESETTTKEVLDARNQYRSIAATGAVLYFVITDLSALDPMYQYSLEYFRKLFISSFAKNMSSDDEDLSSRLDKLRQQLVTAVHRNISRGLFHQHQLLFAFLTTQRLLLRSGDIEPKDINLLERSTLLQSVSRDSTLSQLPGNQFSEEKEASIVDVLLALSSQSAVFQILFDSYRNDPRAWDAWITSADPYKSKLPVDITMGTTSTPANQNPQLQPFFRLVLVRYLREDMFPSAVAAFCNECLYPSAATLGGDHDSLMNGVLQDMDKSTPCLLLLSPGADPNGIVARLAARYGKNGVSQTFHVMSLGQGQGRFAELKMRECARDGSWLLLQNVHLAKSWLPALNDLCAGLRRDCDTSEEAHEQFRLFLAVAPAPYFPIEILQNSVKITTEPPRGMKANLQRSISLLRGSSDRMDLSSDTSVNKSMTGTDAPLHDAMAQVKRQLVLGLSLFHASLQERANFGALGWNLKYEFSDTDFMCVVSLQDQLLQRYAHKNPRFLTLQKQNDTSTLQNASPSTVSLVKRESNMDNLPDNGSEREEERRDDESEDEEDNEDESDNLDWIPWDALRFLTGQVYYGGRVTDEFDRRCLMATLKRFYSRQALDAKASSGTICDPHIQRASRHRTSLAVSSAASPAIMWTGAPPTLDRYLADDGRFCVPSFYSDDAMAKFVDALSDVNAPQLVIGMHPNAHILYQKERSRSLVSMLKQVQSISRNDDVSSGTNGDADEVNCDIDSDGAQRIEANEHAVLELCGAVERVLLPWEAHRQDISNTLVQNAVIDSAGQIDPFVIVLEQELTQINYVLGSIRASIEDLQAAVQGLAVMSATTELIFQGLATGQVPLPWRSLESLVSLASGAAATNGAGFTSQLPEVGSEGNGSSTGESSMSVIVWIGRLLSRFDFFATWARAKAVPPILPLSLFCYPEGLFTAVLQRHARKYSIPIHHLDFDFRVVDDFDVTALLVVPQENADSGVEYDGDVERTARICQLGDLSDSILISGLVLEGAQWCKTRHCLCDPLPGVIQHVMPVLNVRPQLSAALASLDGVSGTTIATNSSMANEPLKPTITSSAVHGVIAPSTTRAVPRAPSVASTSLATPAYLSRRPSQRTTSFRSSRFLTGSAAANIGDTLPPPKYRYACPVYKTSSRKGSLSTTGASTNFVLTIELPSSHPPDHYVLNGTALICSRASTPASNA